MRQVWITRAGPPEVLQVREAPDPEPAAGQARIRVEAAGVNFADLMARAGAYPDAPKIPCVVGYEVAGVVDKLGAGVTRVSVGQPVIAGTLFGGYSSMVCVDAEDVTVRPADMGGEEGAALLVNYLTAYQLLLVMGGVKAGDRVLIHSASGGVGLAALQLCKIVGAVTYGTASAGKHERLREQGLDFAIDYRTRDYAAEVRRLTDGASVTLILDSLGAENWRKNYDLLAPTGRLLCFGVSSAMPSRTRSLPTLIGMMARMPRFRPLSLMNDNKGVLGVNMNHMWSQREQLRAWMAQLIAWRAEGKIAPIVDRAFPFDEAGAAHQHIHDRRNFGKVVLTP